MKVRHGKTFIEFIDDYGWKTRININKNPLQVDIHQTCKEEKRYVYLDNPLFLGLLFKLSEIKKRIPIDIEPYFNTQDKKEQEKSK